MIATARAFFWPVPPAADTAPEPTTERHPPVFIGDAVQPWAGETVLLAILREAALRDLDQSEE